MDKHLRNVQIFDEPQNSLQSAGPSAVHTAQEISQQPAVWKKTYHLVLSESDRIKTFFDKALSHANLEIILTGAGSSAFIGKILEGPFTKFSGKSARAVATTDILTHPGFYISKNKPVLLVSFARSGNSPESSAAVELVNSICDVAFHLIITCNPSGKLVAGISNDGNELSLLLPEETDDKSLVMTSSFTSMLLAGILVTRINNIEAQEKQVQTLAAYGQKIIEQYAEDLKRMAAMKFDRVVFLGSGPLSGAAEESQLKVQEITDGKVIGKHDSYLGFRHGPKAVISQSTLIVYLFSNDEYVSRYEMDLVRDVNAKSKGLYRLGIAENEMPGIDIDVLIQLSDSREKIDEEYLAVCSVLPAQLLGFFTSLKYGLSPDNPSQSGTITRIVEGVNIYPFRTT